MGVQMPSYSDLTNHLALHGVQVKPQGTKVVAFNPKSGGTTLVQQNGKPSQFFPHEIQRICKDLNVPDMD
jgi:hypothetical protein